KLTYGNQAGRDLLEDRHDMRERMKRMEDRLTDQGNQLADQGNQIADLQNQVSLLKQTSEGYQKIRHRFLDVYRRDFLNTLAPLGRANIHEGNTAAHEGDAIADAALYISGDRNDEDVLMGIYGLTALQIAFQGKRRTPLSKFIQL